ncbi:hypothetical protein SAMN05444320_107257 [Streptoalloteichus hindustanus]|uniref:Uncharacterized protein n=1 Tax=Streptoalloteichus hindustanus TaxID=2017 RepID=A0A1M5IG60_STRHI|nr:hypothetical protein SAMN05444320_107257 [Streptoalloteichus hindustanus]
MAALVDVMVMVSFAAFDWHSIAPRTLRRMPAGETAVTVITVAVVTMLPMPWPMDSRVLLERVSVISSASLAVISDSIKPTSAIANA